MNKDLGSLKIYLLDRDIEMCSAWRKHFFGIKNVEVVCMDFLAFMKTYKVDCVVSPANGYALMDGGYDQAISDYFGWDLQALVQKYLIENLYGEQPVGSSIILDTNIEGIKLIHTPTMRYPEKILDPAVIYHCMRTCLITALQNGVNTMVVPAFGAATGEVDLETVSDMMWWAYEQIGNPPQKLDWEYARTNRFWVKKNRG
ncbi:MAG: hypothetical protein HDT28_03375 [Clostridiales bacterium]|nr:hypothetical protein [Clostridiales bacterium]